MSIRRAAGRFIAVTTVAAIAACSSSAPTTPPTAPPTPTTAAPRPPSPGPGVGETCGANDACGDDLACVSYYGIAGARGPQFKTCEQRCEDDAACTHGRHCATIADGPGRVCR